MALLDSRVTVDLYDLLSSVCRAYMAPVWVFLCVVHGSVLFRVNLSLADYRFIKCCSRLAIFRIEPFLISKFANSLFFRRSFNIIGLVVDDVIVHREFVYFVFSHW